MGIYLIALIAIALIILIISIFVIKRGMKEKKEPDYRALYVLGISFTPLGVVMMITTENPGMLGLTALGIIYIILGLKNKDKWKEPFEEKPKQKMLLVAVAIGLLVVLGYFVFLFVRK